MKTSTHPPVSAARGPLETSPNGCRISSRFSLLTAALLAPLGSHHVMAIDYTWNNSGGSANWSVPANWSPAGPPALGTLGNLANSVVGFKVVTGATSLTPYNDLPAGSILGAILFDSGVTSSFTVTGNDLTLSGGPNGPTIENLSDVLQTVSLNIKIETGENLVLRTTGLGAMTGDLLINGVISGGGGLEKQVTSGLIASARVEGLTGLNTYTGKTSIKAGNLSINTIGNLGAGPSSLGNPTTVANGTISIATSELGNPGALIYTGAAAQTNRVIDLARNNATLTQSGTGLLKFTSDFTVGDGAKTLTLDGSTTGSGEISGAIGNSVTGSLTRITKDGSGTWTLSGSNTYSGITTVKNGTLLVSNNAGSGTGHGAVTVNATGALGGTGTIAPTDGNNINVSGMVAPGASIGTLTINLGSTTGTVAMLTGAGFKFELGAVAGPDINSPGSSDLIRVVGAQASDFSFNDNEIDFLGTGTIGFYKLFDTDFDASTWSGLSTDGYDLITGGLFATSLPVGLNGNLVIGGTNFGGDSGDIYLIVSKDIIPEPSAALLGGLGVLFLLRRRRS